MRESGWGWVEVESTEKDEWEGGGAVSGSGRNLMSRKLPRIYKEDLS